jgi:hypothetical protein
MRGQARKGLPRFILCMNMTTPAVLRGEFHFRKTSRLGLKRTTLQSMIKRLDIHPHEYRNGATSTFAKP